MTEIKKNYIYEVHNISEMDRILTVEDRAIFKELYEAGSAEKERIAKRYEKQGPVIDVIK